MKINEIIDKLLLQLEQPLWGHWYIKEKIGSGAYSSVYRVEAKRSERRTDCAALKIQPITANGREFLNEDDKRAYIERQKVRADSEAEIMLDLRRFPNIVFYEDEDSGEIIIDGNFEGYYSLLRMELLKPVAALIREKRFDYSERNILKLACDIGTGIAGAHSVSVIHRDIKLDNFFVDDHGTYKIGDFNVAKNSDSARTMAGTPGYIAPEVYRARSDIDAEYTCQADIYSLGICLYRLMNDMLFPFEDTYDTDEAHSRRNRGEPLLPPRNASEGFAAIILKACEFDVNKRYKAMEEMLADIRALQSGNVHNSRAASVDPEATILAVEEEPAAVPSGEESRIRVSDGAVIFGSYPDSQSGEREPLRWRVLHSDDKSIMLITERIVDAMPYCDEEGASSWESSAVRRFLNGVFYETAFSEEEKAAVLVSSLMNYKNVTYRTDGGAKTNDKVYILSIDEAERFFDSDRDRAALPTEYAVSKGLYVSDDGRAWWWLRSGGCRPQYASDVDYGGDIDSYGNDRMIAVEGIRPVIRVSLSFLDSDKIRSLAVGEPEEEDSRQRETAQVGDLVSFGEYFINSPIRRDPLVWQVLAIDGSEALIITKQCIDARCFDPRDMDLTWKQSEIRRWLNFEFADRAFGDKISRIRETEVSSDENPVYGIKSGIAARDKVFLLSLSEVKEYFTNDAARAAQAAPNAFDKGMYISDSGCAWWWLRSAGRSGHYAANVDYGGDVDYYGSDITAVNGVRPAVWVDISALKTLT